MAATAKVDGLGRGGGSSGIGRGMGRGGGVGRGVGRGRGEVASSDAADVASQGGEPAAAAPLSRDQQGEVLRTLAEPVWWTIGAEERKQGNAATKKRLKPEEFQKHCTERHAMMTKTYEATMLQDSEQRWLRKVGSEGTSGDKVASLTMLIQVCPVLSHGYIKALLGMAGKTGRSDAVMAIDALKDIFVGNLLPDRKLRTMVQMETISPKVLGDIAFTKVCVVSYFEDYLKTAFAAFVQVLSEAAHHTLVFFKNKAIKTAHELLNAKPEQESVLLAILVNKMGDLEPKVSASATYCLKQVVDTHPRMKGVIAKEVEELLARPNIGEKTRYSAVLFLTELVLARVHDTVLAAQLVRIFTAELNSVLQELELSKKPTWVRYKSGSWKKKPARYGKLRDEDTALTRTLVNGIKRVMPFMDKTVAGSPVESDTIDALIKICHTVPGFSTRIEIMDLLYRCVHSPKGVPPPDSFYRLIFEQVVQFELFNSSHRHKAFLLLKKCVPKDVCSSRGVAFARRLLQVGASSEPAVAAVALKVLREYYFNHKADLQPLLGTNDAELRQRPAAELDDDAAEEHFVDDEVAEKLAASGQGWRRYQPLAREPRYAGARRAPLWELHALACHVHPYVSDSAARLLLGETFKDATDDPFRVFSCQELLNNFAYTPKSVTKNSERKKQLLKFKQRGQEEPKDQFNTEKFASKKNVLPHEKFFHMYFRDDTVRKELQRKAKLGKEREDLVDEENAGGADAVEEEEDRFFDDVLKENMPKDGEEGEDDDMSFSDSDMGPSDADGEDDGVGEPGEDDDDDDDDEGDGASGSGASGAGGAESSDASEPEDVRDESSEAPSEGRGAAGRGAKRKAGETGKGMPKDLKKLKKKHSGSTFASAEDFEQLLTDV